MSEEKRMNWVPAPHFYDLCHACSIIWKSFENSGVYHVGSSIHKRDYRDVDVRCIMDDKVFEEWFGSMASPAYNPRLLLMNTAISAWLSKQSGLPIDFQFQQQSIANEQYPREAGHIRHPIGIYTEGHGAKKPDPPEPPPDAG